MIPHSRPTIDAVDIEAVSAVLRSGQIVQGEKVAQFEEAVSQYVGVKGGVATSSGTAALHLSLLALEVKPGDEVIIPSYVCTAILNAVNYTGAAPCPVDIDSDFNISVKEILKSITSKTKAIIVPHMFGKTANLKDLLAIKIPLIEDCAQAIGASFSGRKVGSFGVLSICSFYATKVLATGEGGMVLSGSHELLNKVRDLRDYDNKIEYKQRYNYKMTDLQAALGINQLRRLDSFIYSRQAIAKKYHKALEKYPVSLPVVSEAAEHIYFRYVIKIEKDLSKIKEGLKKQGIKCASPVFKPLHQYLGFSAQEYPLAEKAFKSALSIPIYPTLTDEQAGLVIESLTPLLEE